MNQNCTVESTLGDYGPLTCFQIHDLMAWIEYLAIEWLWMPEFVWKVPNPASKSFSKSRIHAGPVIHATISTIVWLWCASLPRSPCLLPLRYR